MVLKLDLPCTCKFPAVLSTQMVGEGAGNCFGYQFSCSRGTGQVTMVMPWNWTPPSCFFFFFSNEHNSCNTLCSQPAHLSSSWTATETLFSPLCSLPFLSFSNFLWFPSLSSCLSLSFLSFWSIFNAFPSVPFFSFPFLPSFPLPHFLAFPFLPFPFIFFPFLHLNSSLLLSFPFYSLRSSPFISSHLLSCPLPNSLSSPFLSFSLTSPLFLLFNFFYHTSSPLHSHKTLGTAFSHGIPPSSVSLACLRVFKELSCVYT